MTPATISDPFGTEPITEVPLSRAPLARVIVQIRFPQLANLSANEETSKKIIGRLASTYPILREGHTAFFPFGGSDGAKGEPGATTVWQMSSADGNWQVSFCNTYVAFDTGAYVDRTDFLKRFNEIFKVFSEIAAPPYFERLGFRYINRIVDEQTISNLEGLVRPEILGGLALSASRAILQHSICHSVFQTSNQSILEARWGVLPPGFVADPSIQIADVKSWVLDIDVSTTDKESLSSGNIFDRANELALQGYRFFRWIVFDEFLNLYGANK